MDGFTIKVVVGDEGMGGTVPLAGLSALTLHACPAVRQLVRQLQRDHSHQKGNENQRRYEDE
jgi:hypothetical protein